MAKKSNREEKEDTTGRRKATKTKCKIPNQGASESKKSSGNNGTENENSDDGPEVLFVPNSSSDSQSEDEVAQVDDSDEDDGRDGDDGGEEEEEEAKSVVNKHRNKAQKNCGDGEEKKEDGTKKKKKKKSRDVKNSKDKKNEIGTSNCFPLNGISRILKSNERHLRISQEAVFLINKASYHEGLLRNLRLRRQLSLKPCKSASRGRDNLRYW